MGSQMSPRGTSLANRSANVTYILDLNYEMIGQEERYRSVGVTNTGRLLTVIWTIRNGRVRAITAFPAGVSERSVFVKRSL